MMAAIRSIFVMISTLMGALTALSEALDQLCLTAKDQATVFRQEQSLENEAKLAQLKLDTEALPERLKALKAKPVKVTT